MKGKDEEQWFRVSHWTARHDSYFLLAFSGKQPTILSYFQASLISTFSTVNAVMVLEALHHSRVFGDCSFTHSGVWSQPCPLWTCPLFPVQRVGLPNLPLLLQWTYKHAHNFTVITFNDTGECVCACVFELSYLGMKRRTFLECISLAQLFTVAVLMCGITVDRGVSSSRGRTISMLTELPW